MSVLVRIYIPQKDKANITKANLEEGLSLLGKTEQDIKQRLKWCNYEDVFFHGTKDYIRIINN